MSESNVVPISPIVPDGKTDPEFKFIPYEDIVVIEQLTEEKTSGGIIMVGKSKEFQSGRVVAVGPGRVYSTFMDASGHMQAGCFIPCTVQVGDYVVYGKHLTGEPVLIEGKKYLMSRAGDLAGKSSDGTPLKIRLYDPIE